MAKFALGHTKGFVRHFLMVVLQRLDFIEVLWVNKNHSSTELMFLQVLVSPVIWAIKPMM